MSDETFPKIQISIFLGPDRYTAPQLVVRGDTLNEVRDVLNEITDVVDPTDASSPAVVDEILSNLLVITASGNAKYGVAATTAPVQGGFSSDGFTPNMPAQNSGGAPSCKHGVMKWKSGTNASGKPYSGHFCPSFNRQDQCAPVWADK